MKNKKQIVCSIILLLLAIVIFRNVAFGSTKIALDKINNIKIEVPKFSFMLKESDNNISIKNLRSNRVLRKELNEILNNYTVITCNEKNYYYSEKDNYTIIDYGINNYFIYNTIYMKYVRYNYCSHVEADEYSEKLGGVLKAFTFGVKEKKNVAIAFYNTKSKYTGEQFEAELRIASNGTPLEASVGYFIIEHDKLIYTRTKIIEESDKINIPEVSTFTIIEKGVLKLDDNYLREYESEIILK